MKAEDPGELARLVTKAVGTRSVWNGIEHVCFTGGEPSRSVDEALVDYLFDLCGFSLHIETNGMFPIPGIHKFTQVVVSPKLDASRIKNWDEVYGYWYRVLLQNPRVALKVVYDIQGKWKDFDFSRIVEDWGSLKWPVKYLQPLYDPGATPPTNIKEVVAMVMKDPSWRVSEQRHKDWGLR